MGNNGQFLIAVVIGGFAVHGAMTACGSVNTHSPDAHVGDAHAADAPLRDAPATTAVEAPAGTIVAFAGRTAPAGWLLCDGAAVSRTDYATLFNAIGINFGGGDGINTFNLPDSRGRFLRGADNGAGRDPDAASRTASNAGGSVGDSVGTLQSEQFASHRHTINDPGHTHGMATPNGTTGVRETAGTLAGGWDYGDQVSSAAPVTTNTTGITEAAAGGNETRPKNVSVNYIIKT